ncbi:cadherin repeat domain-containing protein [Candidatus Woesearchaeota archaeon]|nr:cadherin repeat domain-containing protein [Candidatus Woesearchaeota archaeon]
MASSSLASNGRWMLLLGVVFLTLTNGFAITQTFETSTVARIVGNSPDEMIAQLQSDKLPLEHVTLYSEDKILPKHYGGNRPRDINETLSRQFPNEHEINFSTQNMRIGEGWEWADVSSVLRKVGKRNLVVIESGGGLENDQLFAESPEFYDDSLTPQNIDISTSNKPVILFDSDFAGIHLPSFTSFVTKLSGKSHFIAPTAFPDKEFTKAFVCSLRSKKDLGTIYRNARNNYYWSSATPSGLTLLSYELYGDPTVNVSIPGKNPEDWEPFCEGFLKDYSSQIQGKPQKGAKLFSLNSGKNETPFLNVGFRLDNYTIEQDGNLTLLLVNNTQLAFQADELVLPYLTRVEEFPLKTIILNVSGKLSDPVAVSLPSLPSWQGQLVNRTCFIDNTSASLSFFPTQGEDRQYIPVRVNPVEVVNCTEGAFRLWRQVNYSISYLPFSPVLIRDVAHPIVMFPGALVNVSISLEKVTLEDEVNGSLVIQKDNFTVSEKEIRINASKIGFNLSFFADAVEQIASYDLLFIQGNDTMTSTSFEIPVVLLEGALFTKNLSTPVANVSLELVNLGNSSMNASVTDYLIKGGFLISNSTLEKNLSVGVTEFNYSYSGLTRENQSYDLIVDIIYAGRKKTLTASIVANHPPILGFLPDISIRENENISITPIAEDADGDALSFTISAPMGDDGFWPTTYDNAGNYTINVTASDGLLTDSQTFVINVKDIVPPAVFTGSIAYPNGSFVEDNASVWAFLNDTFAAASLTRDGRYSLSIPADNLETTEKDGGVDSDLVVLYVNGFSVDRNFTFFNDTANQADLEIVESCMGMFCGLVLNITLELEPGWNLIAAPVAPINVTYPLQMDNGTALIVFSYHNKSWINITGGGLNASMGIWIRAPHKGNISILGTKINATAWGMGNGWNLMGYPYISAKNISRGVKNLTGWTADYGVISYGNGSWSSFSPDRAEAVNTLKSFQPTRGYWIRRKT